MRQEIIDMAGAKFVLLPLLEFEHLQDNTEMLEDILAYQEAEKKNAGHESFPASVVHPIIYGENPIMIYRKYRKMTQVQLAEKVGIARAYLAQLETGKKQGSVEVLKKIASTLNLDLDDIV